MKAMIEQVVPCYVCVYLNATYITLKQNKVFNCIAVCIREDSSKEVLAYIVVPTKSSFAWQEVLRALKERGVEEVLLFLPLAT